MRVLTDVSADQIWRIGKGDGAVLVVFEMGILAYQVLAGFDMKREQIRSSFRVSTIQDFDLPGSASDGTLRGRRKCHLLDSHPAGQRSHPEGGRASSILLQIC